MCIIVYKPMGECNPSWKTLKTCFENNPDGCGFMYAENNAVHIHKGFMSWRKFKTAFKPYKNRTDLPIVMHFRITTNGATSPQNCHPFPLSENVGELKELDFDCNVGIAHNGIISLTSYATKISDTMEFIRKYADCIITSPTWYYNANAGKLLGEIIKSKMLVLSNDGHGEIVGSGWSHEDGVWYSNTTYMPWTSKYLGYVKYTPKKDTYTYKCYGSPTAWDDDDYWTSYDEWYNECKENKRPTECKHWDYDEPVLECIECKHNTWCWSEDQLYVIGAVV